jgi:hypothetical protein
MNYGPQNIKDIYVLLYKICNVGSFHMNKDYFNLQVFCIVLQASCNGVLSS